MKDAIGTCKFCKQTMTIKVPDHYSQEFIDEEVTKKCTCPEAQETAKRESAINLAEQEIRQFFENRGDLEEIKLMLLKTVRPIAERKLDSLTIKKSEYKISIKNGKKGVKANITQTLSEVIAGAE